MRLESGVWIRLPRQTNTLLLSLPDDINRGGKIRHFDIHSITLYFVLLESLCLFPFHYIFLKSLLKKKQCWRYSRKDWWIHLRSWTAQLHWLHQENQSFLWKFSRILNLLMLYQLALEMLLLLLIFHHRILTPFTKSTHLIFLMENDFFFLLVYNCLSAYTLQVVLWIERHVLHFLGELKQPMQPH